MEIDDSVSRVSAFVITNEFNHNIRVKVVKPGGTVVFDQTYGIGVHRIDVPTTGAARIDVTQSPVRAHIWTGFDIQVFVPRPRNIV